ncbi:hypothetical protein [Streptomyces sp. HF10]|uniref:hypothetical protein n=1 Tax=Streptomyces sp. HF10 TaxID=2692233 RepID=UPI0013181416|nr:hypothetical protein [Streptomyces sp. HF10]QHC32866.1 hypothetical protein GR129_32895 [Streptomyces sp. HF10]
MRHKIGGRSASRNGAAEAGVAAERVRVIRHRLRSRAEGYPAEEYKARHLLREKHRAAPERLLDETGPVHGRARTPAGRVSRPPLPCSRC